MRLNIAHIEGGGHETEYSTHWQTEVAMRLNVAYIGRQRWLFVHD